MAWKFLPGKIPINSFDNCSFVGSVNDIKHLNFPWHALQNVILLKYGAQIGPVLLHIFPKYHELNHLAKNFY
jgi:hypothetical protein